MPRVHTSTRKRAVVKHAMNCSACGNEVEVGQQYYSWTRRNYGTSFRHVACGYPRPTQPSGRKTAQIEETILDTDLSAWNPEVPHGWDHDVDTIEVDLDYLRSLMEPVAESAREVGEEYEASADNMPESLQYGSQAEAMREVAQELGDWADNIESFDPSSDTPEWPDKEDHLLVDSADDDPEYDLNAYREAVEEALSAWVDDIRGQAEDMFSDMPEYQG